MKILKRHDEIINNVTSIFFQVFTLVVISCLMEKHNTKEMVLYNKLAKIPEDYFINFTINSIGVNIKISYMIYLVINH